MTDEEGLEYAVQHVCLNCFELGECDKGVHCEFLKIVRECYDDAIEIGRKEKWHDLIKNPDDSTEDVLRWCELSKFEEE